MKDFFDLKNTRYNLRNKRLLKLPEISTSRYGTKALCFKGSLIRNMAPNQFKNLDSIEDFKKHIKDWKPTVVNLPAVVNCVCNYIAILVSVIF